MAANNAARRLTPAALASLRQRRTGAGRAVRRPLQPTEIQLNRMRGGVGSEDEDEEDDGEEDDDDDDDDEDDDVTCWELLTCCWGPRCCVGSCMICIGLIIFSAAVTYGIVRQPSYEQVVTPMRVARQRWFSKTPQNAEEGFILFDRNADGLIGIDDLKQVAKLTTGETVPVSDLQAYIARGDLDGDGFLDEDEYQQMLQAERAAKGKGGGSSPPSPGGG